MAPVIGTRPPAIKGRLDFIEVIPCKDGMYALDWRLIRSITDGYYRSHAKLTHTKTGVNRGGVFADLHVLETDWKRVRAEVGQKSDLLLKDRREALYYHRISAADMMKFLRSLLGQTKSSTALYNKKLRAAHKASMANIRRNVGRWKLAKDTAEAVEKVATTMLLVGAVFIPGAQGLGVAGLGATLKGGAKYRETQNLGAAALEFSGEMLFLRAGPEAAQSVKGAVYYLFVEAGAKGSYDAAKALAEGKSLKEAIASGAVTAVFDPLLGKFAGVPGGKCVGNAEVGKVALAVASGSALMSEQLKKMTTDQIVKYLKSRARAAKTASSGGSKPTQLSDDELWSRILKNAFLRLPDRSEASNPFPYALI